MSEIKNSEVLKQFKMGIKDYEKFITRIVIGLTSYLFVYSSQPVQSYISTKESEKKYALQIEEYNNQVAQYIDNLEIDGYSDLDIIEKLIYDIWNDGFDYYDDNSINYHGYQRIAMLENRGVCRHICDDFKYKLNMINSDYDVSVVPVYAIYRSWKTANIERKKSGEIRFNFESIEEENIDYIDKDKIKDVIEFFVNRHLENNDFPNHIVALVNIPNENLTLVVDPTNCGIGYLSKFGIVMFNNEKSVYLISNKYSYYFESIDNVMTMKKNMFISLFSDYDLKELESKYGIAAQNESIEKIRKLVK